MSLVVKCVICDGIIEHALINQLICRKKECQHDYQRFLIWNKRRKAKDYKVLKIKKTKRETKLKNGTK
jgi:hypothetical protein